MAAAQDWFEIIEFPDRVFRLREPALGALHAANLWLLVADRGALLIDAGVGVAALAPAIRGITDLPVICLLTHAHYDHIGGAHEFSDRRAHALEAATLANPTPQATQWQGWLTAEAFRRFPAPDYDFSRYAIAPARPSEFIEDGAEIDFGGRTVTLLHTPGHSPGLVCALERSTRTLFSSDALYDGPMFFDLPGSSRADAAASVRRLIDIDARVIHPGHFDSLAPDAFRRLGLATLARLSGAG